MKKFTMTNSPRVYVALNMVGSSHWLFLDLFSGYFSKKGQLDSRRRGLEDVEL